MATVQDLYELSPMQQGMLFHTLYAPESSAYFEQRSCLLEGSLEVEAFKQAWQAVVERYAVLRTAFYWEEADKPLQVVYEQAQLPWIEADWQSLSEVEQAQRLSTFLRNDRAQGFQLNQAPLMRCALFQVAPQQHRFVWSHHHLLMDGWCNALLIKEVLAFYAAYRQGQSLSLRPPQPYRNYILWLQQQDQQAAAAYWRANLAGFQTPTPLRIERSRRMTASPRSEHHDQSHQLSASLTTQLNGFAKQHHLTLNTLIQGAWALLLSRYSDTSDIVFGATVSGRPPTLPGAEAIVGLFINTVPVRVAVSPGTQLLPWLHQLQNDQRDRETYSYTALSDMQSWSDLPPGAALFENLLVFENYPVSLDAALTDASSGLAIRDGQGFEQTNYPLTLVVIPGDSLALRISYDRERFALAAIKRLLGHVEALLQGMMAKPTQPLAALSLLSDPESQQLLVAWNLTQKPVRVRCFHQCFEAQVAKTPDAIAVIDSAQTLTYRQLNRRSNQLAHRLRAKGIGPESLVGVHMHRCAELMVALLGVLKAGGAYVPLDPALPLERLRFIVDDADLSWLITHDLGEVGTPIETNCPTLNIKDASVELNQEADHNLAVAIDDDNLAYVIYTSGSTGNPKGTLLTHRGLNNYLSWCIQTYLVGAGKGAPVQSSIGFDATITSLFVSLLAGQSVTLLPERHEIDSLNEVLQQGDRFSLVKLTPSHLQALHPLVSSSTQPPEAFIIGGEALHARDIAFWQQQLPTVRLINEYGPTEAVVGCCIYDVPLDFEDGPVPIGKPIANVQLYVLDSFLNPLPVGVPGELYIGGAGVARGYLNRPDLTAERFIPNPFYQRIKKAEDRITSTPHPTIDNSQSTLYKTGDLVCYRPDGILEYLGRVDDQIKLRGYRIEPGEIEAVLTQHPEVAQAIVTLYEDQLAEQQLVAYVVLNFELPVVNSKLETQSYSSRVASRTDLKTYLSEYLPAYMVPSQFVVLDALPLTPNGKIDRRALPEPKPVEVVTQSDAPLTPTEELLANIWAGVLKTGAIARNQNFFELGGHSLLATQIVAKVRQAFQVELPLQVLFEQPTLTQLAAAVDALKLGDSLDEPLAKISSVRDSLPLPLSDAQQRQWVLAQLEPDNPYYIVPIAVRLTGELSPDRLHQSLEQVVERHEVLRTAFKAVDGKAQLEIYAQANCSIPLTDLSNLDEASQQQQIHQRIRSEAQTPFDLSCAPLLRMQVLRLAEDDHVILLSLHHIITDGWSMGILVRELAQVYDALQTGQTVELPPLPIQYADYAAWQQQQAEQNQQQQLSYWKQQLQGVPPLLELPTDYSRPAVQSFAGATYEFQLAADQTQALQELSQQQGVTLFMTLLAAFQVLLYRYSGIEDLVVGTPIANRQRAELEGLIGMFVNTLVLRTDLSGNPRFEELLSRVRGMALDAYAHQSVPFEQVVEALEVPRSWSHAPLFQVMFVLQNAPMDAIALDGLNWQPLSTDSGTAKFDLTLSMRLDKGELQGKLEYRTDLFAAATIHRMAGHLCQLLQAVAQQPACQIAELPLLTEAEQKELRQWNQTQTEYPRNLCIQQVFEQQVEKTPNAIALICGDQPFTYQALNAQANQLARYLKTTYTIHPDTLIGLWAERSPKTIVAMLAILKAGGAYVPLDLTYPRERLQFMIADAQLSLIVTPGAIELPVEALTCQQLILATEAAAIAQQDTNNLPTSPASDNLAYILYTSGSTGQPKGVCTPHRGVVRLVQDTDYVHFDPDEVFLQAASLSFDASTFEIWGALLNGSKLVFLPTPSPSLAELVDAIAQHQVTTLWLTAGLFHLMVDEQLEALKPVRQLLAGGDVLSTPHIRKALAALPNTRLINGYGPTENTTFTCCYSMTADSLEDSPIETSPPIGYPIANTQIHVLDANLQTVPIGIPGELYISGDGLARGYLNRPELTAERFVPNPFVEVGRQKAEDRSQELGARSQELESDGVRELGSDGVREFSSITSTLQETATASTPHYPITPLPHYPATLYKTGDRVRLTSKGTVEFLGRLDNQVKIRGFRIELGEIETALLSHSAIEQAIVVPWANDAAGQHRLVAYVVQESEVRSQESNSEFRIPNSEFASATPQNLRQYLTEKLPDYMLPAAFVFLDVLPLTGNGKVDRKALPAPVWESAATEAMPQTAVEQTLVDIWSAVLRLESVGVGDNFFDLGGDSILALQMVSRAAQAGVSLSPRQIFQHQTIAELADVAGTAVMPVEADLAVGAVPLTPIQQWFFEQNLANPHHFNQAVCLELPLAVKRDRLEQAIQKVMAYHDVLRLRFRKTDEGWQQWFAESASSGVESVTWFDLAGLSEAEQVEAMAAHADQLQASLDLVEGPLIRVGGFDLGTERPSQLLIVIHHLVVDGLSWRILLEDLLLAYRQGEGEFLPKISSFQQWSLWLQSATAQCQDKETRQYWQAIPKNFAIPVDHNTEENTASAAQTVDITLSSEFTRALLQDVSSTYNTQINDVLLTALVQSFAKWTGEPSLLLTLENYGRHPESLGGELNLARTVGWFTCLHPVYLQLVGNELGEQLKAIKGQLRQVPHQGLSYGLLRYGIGGKDLAVEPSVSFNYLGQFDALLAAAEGFCLLPTPGATSGSENRRSHLLDINGWVRNGQLQLEWTYSRNHYDHTTVESLAQSYLTALQQLIDHCQGIETQGYTPDDFNLVQLDQAALDAVLGKVTFQGGAR